MLKWLNACMNYEFNLLHQGGLVAEMKHVAVAAAAHKGEHNTYSDQTSRGVKSNDQDCIY